MTNYHAFFLTSQDSMNWFARFFLEVVIEQALQCSLMYTLKRLFRDTASQFTILFHTPKRHAPFSSWCWVEVLCSVASSSSFCVGSSVKSYNLVQFYGTDLNLTVDVKTTLQTNVSVSGTAPCGRIWTCLFKCWGRMCIWTVKSIPTDSTAAYWNVQACEHFYLPATAAEKMVAKHNWKQKQRTQQWKPSP